MVVWLSLAEGRLLVATFPHVRRLNVLGELAKSRWLVAHHSGLLFGLSCQICSQCRCSPYLLGHFVPSLLLPLHLPHVSSQALLARYPSWARASSFTTLHRAGVDENDLAC